jgi:hypothetical protein
VSRDPTVVSISREVAAAPAVLFELIIDSAQQPPWDGNDTLGQSAHLTRARTVH